MVRQLREATLTLWTGFACAPDIPELFSRTGFASCNQRAGHIRLNTELVKEPKDLLEYVIVHEMVHLTEPTHNDRFISILEYHYPSCREARAELNELPLTAELWNE